VRLTLLQLAAAFGIGGSLLAVAVPTFVTNLRASKLSEPTENLGRIVRNAISYGDTHAEPESFPPSVELTPKDVPRGNLVKDPPGTWDHLTWRALDFRIDDEHAFSYEFTSAYDPTSGTMRFETTSHGDLDGDGALSTFTVYGEKARGHAARALTGMYVARELE
jgi:hypothetical protein